MPKLVQVTSFRRFIYQYPKKHNVKIKKQMERSNVLKHSSVLATKK